MNNLDSIVKFLNKVELFNGLSSEEIDLIAESSSIKKYNKNDIILRKGQSADYLYVVVSGEVREIMTDVNEFSKFFLCEGEYFYFGELGIFLNSGYFSTVLAESDLTVLRIPKKIISALTDDNDRIFINIISSLSRRLQTALQKEIGYTQMNAETRLAYYIIELCRRHETYTLNTTQEELAVSCGVARQTLSKIVNKWKHSGIVDLKRGKIIIKDPDALLDVFLAL